MSERIDIRPATLADAKAITKLCYQLGYTSFEATVEQRPGCLTEVCQTQ